MTVCFWNLESHFQWKCLNVLSGSSTPREHVQVWKISHKTAPSRIGCRRNPGTIFLVGVIVWIHFICKKSKKRRTFHLEDPLSLKTIDVQNPSQFYFCVQCRGSSILAALPKFFQKACLFTNCAAPTQNPPYGTVVPQLMKASAPKHEIILWNPSLSTRQVALWVSQHQHGSDKWLHTQCCKVHYTWSSWT